MPRRGAEGGRRDDARQGRCSYKGLSGALTVESVRRVSFPLFYLFIY